MGSYMVISTKLRLALGCLFALILGLAACTPRHAPAMTVADLMEDRVTLDGVLMKCNQNPSKARADTDCLNARIAIERLANQSESAEEAKRTAEFERSRDQLRSAQDKLRQEEEAKTKVDAYHLPLVPVDPPPPPASTPAPDDAKSPALGRTNP